MAEQAEVERLACGAHHHPLDISRQAEVAVLEEMEGTPAEQEAYQAMAGQEARVVLEIPMEQLAWWEIMERSVIDVSPPLRSVLQSLQVAVFPLLALGKVTRAAILAIRGFGARDAQAKLAEMQVVKKPTKRRGKRRV
jgi:hypothetical protein